MIPKFRVWVKSESRMIDSEKIASLDFLKKQIVESKIFANKDGSLGVVEYTYHNFDDVELMQATGLKDENGIEIYEWDVVVVHSEDLDYEPLVCEIYYSRFWFCWCLKDIYDEEVYRISSVNWDELEIIGNVYEHPKLLKGELRKCIE